VSCFATRLFDLTFLSRLFADLVNDSLQEFAYDAELAGLVFHSGSHHLGLMITLDGYNEKLPVLARRVLETVRNLQVLEDRLAVIKEKVIVSCYISPIQEGLLWSTR
jgi:insulysin